MKIEYSRKADALYIQLKPQYVAKSKEIEEGVVVDFDRHGHVLGIEILDVSERLSPQDLANITIKNLPTEKAG